MEMFGFKMTEQIIAKLVQTQTQFLGWQRGIKDTSQDSDSWFSYL